MSRALVSSFLKALVLTGSGGSPGPAKACVSRVVVRTYSMSLASSVVFAWLNHCREFVLVRMGSFSCFHSLVDELMVTDEYQDLGVCVCVCVCMCAFP